MKRIAYVMPVNYLRGNLSGNQDIMYNNSSAYDLGDGERVSADNYEPRLVAKITGKDVYHLVKYFQIRTRTTINMTNAMRTNLALMGGTGAIVGALMRDKTANIYKDCVRACPKKMTLRAFVSPIIRTGLAIKASTFTIADGVTITNPWIYQGTQTLNIDQNIINKFNSILS